MDIYKNALHRNIFNQINTLMIATVQQCLSTLSEELSSIGINTQHITIYQ
jgi:hypothetical protein